MGSCRLCFLFKTAGVTDLNFPGSRFPFRAEIDSAQARTLFVFLPQIRLSRGCQYINFVLFSLISSPDDPFVVCIEEVAVLEHSLCEWRT